MTKQLNLGESIFFIFVIIIFLIGVILLIVASTLDAEKYKKEIRIFKLFWWISFGIFVLAAIYLAILNYLANKK